LHFSISLLGINVSALVVEHLFLCLNDSVFLVFNDGVEVEVESVGNEETEPFHGEIPVLKLVVLGDLVCLAEAGVRVNHSLRVIEEGNNLNDIDEDEADNVDVMHDSAPDDKEPDDIIVVSGTGKDPEEGSRNPLEHHTVSVDVLGETPHGVGVRSESVLSRCSVLSGGNEPEVVVVVLEPVHSKSDGGSSEHKPGGVLSFIPVLHAVVFRSGVRLGSNDFGSWFHVIHGFSNLHLELVHQSLHTLFSI